MEEGDGLPSSICEECLGMVEQGYLFKKKCQLNDSKLREHLRLTELNEESKVSLRLEDEKDVEAEVEKDSEVVSTSHFHKSFEKLPFNQT